MMQACKAKAARNKWQATIPIVDNASYLVLLERTANTTPISRRPEEVAIFRLRFGHFAARSHEYGSRLLSRRHR
jgi:hypothetical protein